MKLSAHSFRGFNKCHVFAALGKGTMGLKFPPHIAVKESRGESDRLNAGEVRRLLHSIIDIFDTRSLRIKMLVLFNRLNNCISERRGMYQYSERELSCV